MVTIPHINGDPTQLDLSYGTDMGQRYKVRRVQFGDSYSQRARDGMNSTPQQWKLNWSKISDADAEMLRLFFERMAGVDVIEWKPYNQTDTLKWTANDWSGQPSGWMVQDCSITLTQEFDL